MPSPKPALSLAAVPGRRQRTLDLAKEIEDRGFAGIYCPSFGDCMALSEGIALVTERIEFGTSVAPIYFRSVEDYAQSASFIHEISNGRFRFGIGVSHERVLVGRGLDAGRPLADIRAFVDKLQAVPQAGELPPLMLATLRKKMIALAGEVSAGLVFANAARSHIAKSLSVLPPGHAAQDHFFIGNMIPTCIDDDAAAARAVLRKTLVSYARLPNYRNYWKEAGYIDEMNAVEKAIREGNEERIGNCLSDRWLADTTIAGPANRVREELERWYAAGIKTPILVPSSTKGGQMKAFKELFAVFE